MKKKNVSVNGKQVRECSSGTGPEAILIEHNGVRVRQFQPLSL